MRGKTERVKDARFIEHLHTRAARGLRIRPCSQNTWVSEQFDRLTDVLTRSPNPASREIFSLHTPSHRIHGGKTLRTRPTRMLSSMDTCILELGTREIRLLRARLVAGGGNVETVAIENELVSADESIDRTGSISPGAAAEAEAVVLRLLDAARVRFRDVPVYAIAPHALGGAKNARTVLDSLARRIRIPITSLSARDTARLAYRAARVELGAFDGQAAVVHLGDAATDLASGTRGSVDLAETLTMGVARLHRAYGGTDGGLPIAEANALFSLVRLCAGPAGRRVRDWGASALLVTGECAAAVRDVATAWGFLDEDTDVLGRVALHALAAEIIAASPEDLENARIGPNRAPLVGTAAVMIDAFCDLLGQRDVALGSSGAAAGAALDVLTRPPLRLASGA